MPQAPGRGRPARPASKLAAPLKNVRNTLLTLDASAAPLYSPPMPELAEVEYYRKRWNPGLGEKIQGVSLNSGKRIFRGSDTRALEKLLVGATLQKSEAHGKQMLFRFSKQLWLGVHLGMTGTLRVEKSGFRPGKHDHLVLHQKRRTLVFNDPRQFGRLRFHHGAAAPEWWAKLPPAIISEKFTVAGMDAFLRRHRQLPLKAALLHQAGFPGIGNWMADEILWRVRLHPRTRAGEISGEKSRELWRVIRFVCREACKIIGHDFSDPPRGWFIHERWTAQGRCPRHGEPLPRATIGGRTTAWCPKCQPERVSRPRRS